MLFFIITIFGEVAVSSSHQFILFTGAASLRLQCLSMSCFGLEGETAGKLAVSPYGKQFIIIFVGVHRRQLSLSYQFVICSCKSASSRFLQIYLDRPTGFRPLGWHKYVLFTLQYSAIRLRQLTQRIRCSLISPIMFDQSIGILISAFFHTYQLINSRSSGKHFAQQIVTCSSSA